jgi:hypothetical protein
MGWDPWTPPHREQEPAASAAHGVKEREPEGIMKHREHSRGGRDCWLGSERYFAASDTPQLAVWGRRL